MKVFTKDGKVFAEAETIGDIKQLFAFKKKEVVTDESNPSEKKPRRQYKKQYVRDCDICGKKVKGLVGLNIHKRYAHPPQELLTE